MRSAWGFVAVSLAVAAGCGGGAEAVTSPSSSPSAAASSGADLVFVADRGIRVDQAAIPEAGIEPSGVVHLYYQDNVGHGERVAVAPDGLAFGGGAAPADRAWDPRRVLLPDGTWRLYQLGPDNVLRSSRSTDGARFSEEPGVRYQPAAADNGSLGIYELFSDAANGVVMLYLGDLRGLNNTRRAYSTDNGASFTFQRADVLGDAALGGGGRSFVDITTLRLPDGRRRLFAMQGGQGIYSFLSADDGRTFTQEAGARVSTSDWPEYRVTGLFDPSVVRLPDGRYRMYVCANLDDGSGRREAILSATTR